MKDVLFVSIVDGNGNPIYIRERYIQGSSAFDYALLSNIVGALEQFASELGQKEVNVIRFQDSSIYTIKDKLTNINFYLNGGPKAKPKEMTQLLSKIKDSFITAFTGHLHDTPEEKRVLLKKFEESLEYLLKEKWISDPSKFLMSI